MNRIQNGHAVFFAILMSLLAGPTSSLAGQQPAVPMASARAVAPVDFTGYWVSVITEDWRLRMAVPRKGDYTSVPLTPEGRRVADTWDPARDVAEGAECRAFGAPGVMRLPVRLHVTWDGDNTLKIDTDTGRQTRLLNFGESQPGEPSWQGHSVATWEFAGGEGRGQKAGDHLKVVTRNLRPGYLRRNGVPYSEMAVLTEYFVLHQDVGTEWITHTRIVDDPVYLRVPYVVTSHFRRENDNSKWNPVPCRVD